MRGDEKSKKNSPPSYIELLFQHYNPTVTPELLVPLTSSISECTGMWCFACQCIVTKQSSETRKLDPKFMPLTLTTPEKVILNTELNDLKIIICLRKSEVTAERISVCNVIKILMEHGIHCLRLLYK